MQSRRFECIKVNFLGKVHAQWTMVSVYKQKYGQTTRAPVRYSGDQVYIQESLLFCGHPSGVVMAQ